MRIYSASTLHGMVSVDSTAVLSQYPYLGDPAFQEPFEHIQGVASPSPRQIRQMCQVINAWKTENGIPLGDRSWHEAFRELGLE